MADLLLGAPRASRRLRSSGNTVSRWVCRSHHENKPLLTLDDDTGQPHIPEHLILRDTLYLLQGISGKYVQFSVTKDAEQNKELIFAEDPVSVR